MASPLISVIIPTYNYGNYIEETILSVLNQTYKNVEILVIDDGSTDNTWEIVSKFKNEINFLRQENLGQSQARNHGFDKARGSVYALLDADDYWEPEKLEKQIPLMNDAVGLVYCGARLFDTETLQTIEVVHPKFRGPCEEYFLSNLGVQIVSAGESSALIDRRLAEKVGEFDSRLSISSGYDFYRRCSTQTSFNFVEEILVNYRQHNNNISKKSDVYLRDLKLATKKMISDSDSRITFAQKIWLESKLEFTIFKSLLKKKLG